MEENKLEGQVAWATGASRGIGLSIARRLGRMGAKVAMCARNAETLRQAAAVLQSEGIEVLAAPADVTRAGEIAALVHKIQDKFGFIDILVNNAGIGLFAPFHTQSEADFDGILDTNLKSAFLTSGRNTFANGALYCASKWGLLGLTGCMAEDLRAYGIRVSAVCPGTVATEFSPHAGKDPSRMLQPDDVAHAVAALVTQAPGSFISEVQMRPTRKP
jgi:3-oxoacyl-[acyl-carrier protein] reductase